MLINANNQKTMFTTVNLMCTVVNITQSRQLERRPEMQQANTQSAVREFFNPLLTHEGLSYYLEDINPLWSLTDLRARVISVINETHDTRTFELKANRHWDGFTAGQNIGVNVEINGVTHKRRYSMSSVEEVSRTFTITVKRVPDGRVSNWLHDNVEAGDVLNLAAPAGDFVLPAELPDKILMLAAGSGITPLMSQLKTLLGRGYDGDIEFLHYVRSPGDHIFGAQLKVLVAEHSNLNVTWCEEDDELGSPAERFSPEQIMGRVPDYQERHTMLCGPAGFMAAVREHWEAIELTDQLQFEYFGTPPMARPEGETDYEVELSLGRKNSTLTAQGSKTLLDVMLDAGETPAYGCKMGICHECKCKKTSGAVRNVLTGEVSTDADENIQLCISVAESDVELDY